MTTFFNYENPEFFGISSFMPDFPVSSIVDNLILLNFVELDNSPRDHGGQGAGRAHPVHPRISDRARRHPLSVTARGGPGVPVLPFPSYYGLLSRARSPLRFPIPAPEAMPAVAEAWKRI